MLDDMDKNFENLYNKGKDSNLQEIETLQLEVTKHKEEIKFLKRKLLLPEHSENQSLYSSNQFFNQILKEKMGELSLYESIIIHIKTINVRFLLEIYDLNLQREEEVRNILSEKNKGNLVIVILINSKKQSLQEYKTKAFDLIKNFDSLKIQCEKEVKDFEERSKMYIPPEVKLLFMQDLEKICEEYKNFTQGILDEVLNTLMGYKSEEGDFVIFKMPVNI